MPPPRPPPGLVEMLFLIVVLYECRACSLFADSPPPRRRRSAGNAAGDDHVIQGQIDAVVPARNVEYPVQPVAADRGKAAAGGFDRQIVCDIEIAGLIVVFTAAGDRDLVRIRTRFQNDDVGARMRIGQVDRLAQRKLAVRRIHHVGDRRYVDRWSAAADLPTVRIREPSPHDAPEPTFS